MSDIRDFARDTLQAAQADLAKARHALPLAAGILALIHLLTVHPYIEAARDIAAVESTMKANDTLIAGLDPDIAKLRETAERSGAELQTLLAETTDSMIGRFARLRQLVASAMAGEKPPALPNDVLLSPEGTEAAPGQMPGAQMQQMPMMQMQQMPLMNMPMSNMPAPMARLGEGALPGERKLAPILDAFAARQPDADARLTAFAKESIVGAAYGDAQDVWREDIQPEYLAALESATATVRAAQVKAMAVSPEAAAKLGAAADDLARQQAAIAAVEIGPDNTLDAALGTDWWRTVEGKGAFADAVTDSVRNRMRAIAQTAGVPADALRDIQRLQQELHDGLLKRQASLEEQFSRHREQLASLSGTSGVIPVDLASFIGLFPLVIGIVLGALLLRGAQARRQAALAADAFARAAPEDGETRRWLVMRALGGNPAGCWIAGLAVAGGAILWIGLAGWHVAAAPSAPPLPAWLSFLAGSLLVAGAAGWDLWSVRRLSQRLEG